MNNRQAQLLQVLSDHQTYTIKDLSIRLAVSYRTIQNDINALKAESIPVISQPNKGVSLYGEIKEIIHPDRLPSEVLFQFVNTDDWLKVEDLANQFYVSGSSMKAIIKTIREEISSYYVELISRPGYGLKLSGKEEDIRRMIRKVKGLYHPDPEARSIIEREVDSVLASSSLTITDESRTSLIRDLDIACQRLKQGHSLELETSELSYLYNFPEFETAQALSNRLSASFHLPRVLSETAGLFKMIQSRRRLSAKTISEMEDSVREGLDALITAILDRIEAVHHVDLHPDLDLYMALGLHLIPLISRIRFNFQISNPLLEEVRRTYPQAFDLAVTAGQVLEEQFDIRLAEDEIGYLATHFGLALERKKSSVHKKRVLVVCSSGGGMSRLLAYKIQRAFPDYMETIRTCDLHELDTLDLDLFDYVITTVPLLQPISKPTLQISHMLTRRDMERLKHGLSQRDEPGLKDLTLPDTFFNDIQSSNRSEILQEICGRLEKIYPLQSDFYAQVLAREDLYSTEIGNGVAFPHPLHSTTPESFVSITVLKKPVRWIHEMVQIIIVANTAKGESSQLQTALDQFAAFVSDQEAIVSLIKSPTYENCCKLMQNL